MIAEQASGPSSAAAPPLLAAAADMLRSGDAHAAEAAFEAILRRSPGCDDALLGLAMALGQRGEFARAKALLRRGCVISPTRPEMWDALGMMHSAAGEHVSAEAAYAAAQHRAPQVFDIALRRIGAAFAAGMGEAELARLEAGCARDPLDAVQLAARGALLRRMGRQADAIDVLEVAVALAPELAGAALEYAVAVTDRDPPAVAEAALRRAIPLVPARARELQNNLAVVLLRRHRYHEARNILESLLAEEPDEPRALCNLSNTLVSLGLQREALAAARHACAIAPGMHLAWRATCNALPYSPGVTGLAMLDAAKRASSSIVRHSGPPSHARAPFGHPSGSTSGPGLRAGGNPTRRLRLGLLSPMLKTHPVGWLTIAGFEQLDPAGFEIVCIAQARSGDPIARRFQAIASEWHVIADGGSEAVAAQVRALDVDLLIDLSGYGDRGCMAACAHRMAPVQLKWVGMQNHSTGLAEMDWFITDRWETPPGFERFYSERLLRLRDGYVCYSPPPYAPDVAPSPAVASGAVTFGCFNNLAKITPEVIRSWSRILHRAPGSRLVLKTHQLGDAETRDRLMADFMARGVRPERVILRGGSSHRALLAEYGDVDIVIDPFPYTGGLTTCEALWMGVPTVTLAGEIFAARHAASHMSNVGLPGWVATDLAAYEDLAASKAADIDALARLRNGLRAQVRASPLCDHVRFGRSLGAGLRHAWTAWCAANPPAEGPRVLQLS